MCKENYSSIEIIFKEGNRRVSVYDTVATHGEAYTVYALMDLFKSVLKAAGFSIPE